MDANCFVEQVQKIPTTGERQNLTAVQLAIWGMGCPNCAKRVSNGLLALKGVVSADVDHTTGFAFVEFNNRLVSTSDLLQAVAQAGDDGRHKYVAMLLEDVSL